MIPKDRAAPREGKRGRGRRFLLAFLIGYLTLVSIGLVLSFSDAPRQVDALVLLSGGNSSRLEETADLYKQGFSSRVILTRATGSGRNDPIDAYQGLTKLGVPGSAVLFTPGQSDSTFDEARHVLELMESKGFGGVLVVTDSSHAFRARLVFRGEFRKSGKSVWVRAASRQGYTPLTWMFSAQGWQATLKEAVKIGAYFLGVKGS